MYVGDDEKLHFVDKDGADSVLPFNFSNNKSFTIKIKYEYKLHAHNFTDSNNNKALTDSFIITYNAETEEITVNKKNLATLNFNQPGSNSAQRAEMYFKIISFSISFT